MTKAQLRFSKIDAELIGEEPNKETEWYLDLSRPLPAEEQTLNQKYIAVQVYAGKNPNHYVPVENLGLLFNDQAEYYAICPACREIHYESQWAGSTRNPNWREDSREYLKEHQSERGWCEFCDPIFGNGGWS